MTEEIRNRIMAELGNDFTPAQLNQIDHAVAKALQGYKITEEETLPAVQNDVQPMTVKEFIARKRVKGCSDGTIQQYTLALDSFVRWAQKDLTEMTDLDILVYLDFIKTTRNLSNGTLETQRCILSSFYTFLQGTGRITKNPMKSVDPIKYKSKVREPLTDVELERVRGACETPKEKAIVEVLYSTGARAAEIVGLNKSDIDVANRRAIITGKGNKERFVFFNAKSLVALKQYLETRDDDNEALFVRSSAPHTRITKSGLEYIIKGIGERAGLNRPLFPHLFRHTFATDMLGSGASINEVSKILGHESIETTLIYAKSSTEDLATSHRKHIA